MTAEKFKINSKNFYPKSELGKLTLRLMFCFLFFFLFFWLFVKFGYRGGNTFFSQPVLSIPISLAGISGVAMFATGAAAIYRQRERSALVFISTFVGAFVLYFIFGELMSPH